MSRAAEEALWDVPIVLAATPIGNLSDATARLRALLESAEVIAAEDTRHTRHLCRALGIVPAGRMVSLHEHNEAARAEGLIAQAAEGTRVLVVSDAGMPAVSDPGFRLVAAAIASDVGVTVAPGASAVTTALALSGLPTDTFTFAGFVPRKTADRNRLLRRLAGEEWTTVLFDSPHRITATLQEFAGALGAARPAALCRELTKRHEEVLRGPLGELAETAAARSGGDHGLLHHHGPLRGEMVLVLGGAETGPEGTPTAEELAGAVLERVAGGERLKSAAKALAAEHGVSARDLYEAAIARRG